jgi:hypothetical protein
MRLCQRYLTALACLLSSLLTTAAVADDGPMSEPTTIGQIKASLRVDSGVPRLYLKPSDPNNIPAIEDFELVMHFADGTRLVQDIGGLLPYFDDGAWRLSIQPDGREAMAKLVRSRPAIDKVAVRLQLESPTRWETVELPTLDKWLGEPETIGETTIQAGFWGPKPSYRTVNGKTTKQPNIAIHLYGEGPIVGKPDAPLEEDNGFFLRLPNGERLETTLFSAGKLPLETGTMKYWLHFTDDRIVDFSFLRQCRLEIFTTKTGYQQTRQLKEWFPAYVSAGKTDLLLYRNPSFGMVLQSDSIPLRNRIKRLEHLETGQDRPLAESFNLGSFESFKLEGLDSSVLDWPDQWRLVLEAPVSTELVEIGFVFDDVHWP